MTDVQWKSYKENVKGTWLIDNPATVREVGAKSWLAGGYPIFADFTGDCDFYYVAKTEEEALRFAKGQRVSITTQINFIDERLFGGMTYYAEGFTTEIR
ncbi:MAG: hypothetical protein HGA45_30750 [Chloroflexales bacterium]|nr:hypothetical protein [Chloroflexales bacterium]